MDKKKQQTWHKNLFHSVDQSNRKQRQLHEQLLQIGRKLVDVAEQQERQQQYLETIDKQAFAYLQGVDQALTKYREYTQEVWKQFFALLGTMGEQASIEAEILKKTLAEYGLTQEAKLDEIIALTEIRRRKKKVDEGAIHPSETHALPEVSFVVVEEEAVELSS